MSLHGIDVWLPPYSVEFYFWVQWLTVLNEDGFPNFSMTVSNAVLPEGSKITHIHQQFSPLNFTHCDLPGVPESFDNIENCRWYKTSIDRTKW